MKKRAWQGAAVPSLPDASACHGWLWSLDRSDRIDLSQEILSADENVIADRFLFEEDRRKYVACHCQMRFLLSGYLQCSPTDVQLVLSPFGKPILKDRSKELHFSLSHTSSHAILAVARQPVGVDLELIRPIEPEVAAFNFSSDEQRQLALYTGEAWTQCFFRCWTRKEALVKAEGTGLNVPLASFDVEIGHDRPPAVLRHRADAGFTRAWELHDISPSKGLVAAIAVAPGIKTLTLLSFDPKFVQR